MGLVSLLEKEESLAQKARQRKRSKKFEKKTRPKPVKKAF